MIKTLAKNKRIERGEITRGLLALFKDIEELAEPLFVHSGRVLLEALGVNEKSYHLKGYLNSRLKNLIDNGYIIRKTGKLILSDKGKVKLATIFEKSKKKPKRWDRRWRIVMFDVYEKRRTVRDKFRRELKEYGFIQLQRSVWIYPYECEEFISLLKTDNSFGKNVRYGVLEALEGDAGLQKYFDL